MANPGDDAGARLQRISSAIPSLVLPAIGFALVPRSDLPPGTSKLGGAPDLPADFPWPENKGRPLDFLLQADLAAADKQMPESPLPKTGLLSFFYDLDRQPWGYDPANLRGFHVAYTPATQRLVSWHPPNDDCVLVECAMKWFAMQTLPRDGSRAFERFALSVGLSHDEREAYYNFAHRFERLLRPEGCGGNHRLFGHSDDIQGDMQTEAQFVTNGVYCGGGMEYSHPRAAELQSGADDWLLLLQLDSDDSAGFMWGDAGMLYFWIHSDDLKAQRFDRVWMTMQY